jgi:hypothetical protein
MPTWFCPYLCLYLSASVHDAISCHVMCYNICSSSWMHVVWCFVIVCFAIFSFAITKDASPLSLLVGGIAAVIGTAAINSTIPLCYEFGVHIAAPIGEVAANGMLTWLLNAFGLLFMWLTPLLTPSTMNWLLTASCIVSSSCLLVFRAPKRIVIESHAA